MTRPVTDLARRSAIDAVHGVLEKVGPAKLASKDQGAALKSPDVPEGLMKDIRHLQIQSQAVQASHATQAIAAVHATPSTLQRKQTSKQVPRLGIWRRVAAGGFAWKRVIWCIAITMAIALTALIIFRPDWTFAHSEVLRLAPQIGVSTSKVVVSTIGCGVLSFVFLIAFAYIRGRNAQAG